MKSLSILVVEDDAMIGLFLSDMLVELGHTVSAVETTEAGAVMAALRCPPDFMVVDAHLSEGCGLAAVAEILRAGPVPHIFISGTRLAPPRPDAVMLQKPFLPAELVRAMHRALGDGVA